MMNRQGFFAFAGRLASRSGLFSFAETNEVPLVGHLLTACRLAQLLP
jgi:hypothetical protein